MSEKNKLLNSIQSKQPNYPDSDFFDQLAENVIAKHSNSFEKKPIYKNLFVRWTAAAAIIIPIVFFLTQKNQTESNTYYLSELDKIPNQSITDYIQDQKQESVLLAFETTDKTAVIKTIDKLTEEVELDLISNYLEEEYDGIDDEY